MSTKTVATKLDTEGPLFTGLEEFVDEHDMSRSEAIRHLIREQLEEEQGDRPKVFEQFLLQLAMMSEVVALAVALLLVVELVPPLAGVVVGLGMAFVGVASLLAIYSGVAGWVDERAASLSRRAGLNPPAES